MIQHLELEFMTFMIHHMISDDGSWHFTKIVSPS